MSEQPGQTPGQDNLNLDEEARMTFTEHLAELRTRIVNAGLAVGVAMLLCYFFSDQIFDVIRKPLSPVQESFAAADPSKGLFLSLVDSQGVEQWKAALGVYLEGTAPVGHVRLSGERWAIAANRIGQDETPQGVYVVVRQTDSKEDAYKVETVQLWKGAAISSVYPDNAGNAGLLWQLADAKKDEEKSLEPEIVDIVKNGEAVAEFDQTLVALGRESASGGQWTVLSPLEAFIVRLKLAAYFGLVLALPVVIWQLCAFIFPGLRQSEQRVARILIVGCGVFAVAGVILSYAVIFPLVLPFLIEWAPEGVLVQFRMNETVNIIIRGLIAFAIAFQLPMVVLVLVYLELMTSEVLRKYRKVAAVIMAVVSAMLTPPDPASLFLMWLPLMGLYEVSILVARLVERRRRKRAEAGAT